MENSNVYVLSKEGFFEQYQRITGATRVFDVDPLVGRRHRQETDFSLAVVLERQTLGSGARGAGHSGNVTMMGMVNGSWKGRS